MTNVAGHLREQNGMYQMILSLQKPWNGSAVQVRPSVRRAAII